MFSLVKYAQSILQALPPGRLLALDVFRGITITAMVLVNNPGSWQYVYAPMRHANWHGWTPTDLIFPFFVFIIGISISIVMRREQQRQTSVLHLIRNAGVRAAKLFALGLFLALFYFNFLNPNYSWLNDQLMSIRWLGVLQRLGLVFFFTFTIVALCKQRGQLLWALSLLFGYWAALIWVPYSDQAGNVYKGVLEHGNSLTAWVDAQLFAAKHLYYSTAQPFAFDPEGLLSTLPAISGCLFGVFVGNFVTDNNKTTEYKALILMVLGLLAFVIGLGWDLVLPINKALWTSSFVLMSTGLAMLFLGLLMLIIDVKGHKLWSAPFVVFGANAIFFYMFSGVLARLWLMVPVEDTSLQGWFYLQVLKPTFGDFNGSLAFALLMTFVCYLATHWMYKRGIFWKV